MELESVGAIISTLGFPIVAYLLMFFKLDKTIEKLEGSINNNTELIKLLIAKEKGD
jgi:hypothetical protein